ncbi:glycosyltransferase [Ruminococcaceae bacterium OttesenSCG-928-I18]|nr:glycosyltransferase [Ruminococcaceae bacterium OttesenSCG-928-I18]
MDTKEVNSLPWWDDYFGTGQWEKHDGASQTRFFARIALENLPDSFIEEVLREQYTVGDIGCAEGDATDYLSKNLPGIPVVGIDYSEIAVKKAREKYPQLHFEVGEIGKLPNNYDILFCSNVLEHLPQPERQLEALIRQCNQYVVLLVPFEEQNPDEFHINIFSEEFFSKENDLYTTVFFVTEDTSEYEPTYWPGKQALAIFKKTTAANRGASSAGLPTADTWDKVAEQYSVVIEEGERQLADEIIRCLQEQQIYPGSRLLELGCGSGHLSACLAQAGYKTSLLDFSKESLKKAKLTYERYGLEGKFLQGDIMDLQSLEDNAFDLVWNSGVMEHFADDTIYDAFLSIAQITHNRLLVLVPNPKSISYLLMRYVRQANNDWPYGKEYLRKDYVDALQAVGFERVETIYLADAITKHNFWAATQGSSRYDAYFDLMDRGFLPPHERYLVGYFAQKEPGDLMEKPRDEARPSFDADHETELFDVNAERYGLRKKTEELSSKNEWLEAETERLGSALENLEKEAQALREYKEYGEEHIRVLERYAGAFKTAHTAMRSAESQCQSLAASRAFNLVHLWSRFVHQLLLGPAAEKKDFFRWLFSGGRNTATQQIYQPLTHVVNTLQGAQNDIDQILSEETPPDNDTLATVLEREKNFLSTKMQHPASKQAEILREAIETREYEGILVYPCVVAWKPFQTPQQLLRAFARRGWLCFFCEHPNLTDNCYEAETNLFITQESDFLQAVGETPVTVLLTWMASWSFVELIPNKRIWYHVLDKIDIFPYYSEQYKELHEQVQQQVDVISYVARPLCEHNITRPDAIYLPNGANPGELLKNIKEPIPEDMAKIVEKGHKIIGYYGLLARWMDYELIRQGALARPDYEFVFIGEAIVNTAKIKSLPNVHLLGLKPYEELARYAKCFDVATIPFLVNDMMDCVSPIKFYEYCIFGLPVVSSRMPEIIAHENEFIGCFETLEEYLDLLDSFTRPEVKEMAAQHGPAIGQQNTWDSRAVEIEKMLCRSIDEILTQTYRHHDVIVLSIIDFDFRYQRPQHIATQFARAGHRVFYVNVNHRSSGLKTVKENLYVVDFENEAAGSVHLTDWHDMQSQLHEVLDNLVYTNAIRDAVVLVDYPNWLFAARYLKEQYGFSLVTDYMDDFTGFLSTTSDILRENCETLLRESDSVIASSQFLYDTATKYNDKVEMVRNGTEFSHFHRAYDPSLSNSRKIVGYYGAVSDWFDADKVCHAAQSLPNCDFVIIGQVTAHEEQLRSCANIQLLGEKPYAEIPEYLKTFDVCLIPFDTSTDLIKATNPVKFYEYLSAGKKIVATDIPELKPFENRYVYLCSDKEDFLHRIQLCLQEEDELLDAEACIDFAKGNDWMERFSIFQSVCAQSVPSVSIIVLTYNNLEYNRLCIESILSKTAYPRYELFIVDNGSTDGTAEYLKALEKENIPGVRFLFNEENLGFSGGNNAAIEQTDTDYVVLLNNDTVVTRGWLTALIKHLEADEKMGLCGPVTNGIGNESKIIANYAGLEELHRFGYEYTAAHMNQLYPKAPKVLAMFCLAIKREVINTCGPLDTRYSIGMFEDDDYCRTATRAGYRMSIAEDSFVHHFFSISFKQMAWEEYLEIHRKNRELFSKKWSPLGEEWTAHLFRDNVNEETNREMDYKGILSNYDEEMFKW